MSREKYNWNPVFSIVMDVKDEYNKRFNSNNTNLEHMVESLDDEEINEFFDCLQVNQVGSIALIRYGLAELQRGMWEDENSPYREARSIVIDIENEEIVTCGFRKFFNLDEVEENKLENVQKMIEESVLFEVANKLDGSMQNARWYNGEVFMNGSMALEDKESWRLVNGKSLLTNEYVKMIRDNEHLTFTFEYVSNENPHVVMYDDEDEGLYVLGARDVRTGYQLTHGELSVIVEAYEGIKMAQLESRTLDEMLELMREYKSNEKEGWVIRIDDHLIKIKCDDYVKMHRILDEVASENVIIRAIHDDYWDDMYSKVPEGYKERVDKTADKVYDYLELVDRVANSYVGRAPKSSRKTFMLWSKDNVPKYLLSHVTNIYLDKPKRYLRSRSGRYLKMKEIDSLTEELRKSNMPTFHSTSAKIYLFGSRVYGTHTDSSDRDCIVIKDSLIGGIDREEPQEHHQDGTDYIIYNKKMFIEAIDEHEISVLECIFQSKDDEYRKYFTLDKQKLRRGISAKASNSYVKCKKKLQDGEAYIGLKSLFHSLRILDFGIQIAEYGEIIDYASSNEYFYDIMEIGDDWDTLHKKYKPIYNSLKSKLRKLCPLD